MTVSSQDTPMVSISPEIAARLADAGRSGGPLRISYIGGPGDLGGTFSQWRDGMHDKGVPIATYSAMFYELAERIGAEAQILTEKNVPKGETGRFTFERVARPAFPATRFQWFKAQYDHARAISEAVTRYDPDIVVVSSHAPKAVWKNLSPGRTILLSNHNTFWAAEETRFSVKERIKHKVLSHQLGHVDGTVCVSPEIERQMKTLAGEHHEARVARPQVLRRYEIRERDTMRSLLFLGRIETFKGIYELLDAYRDLRPDYPDLTLDFAGAGTASADFAEYVRPVEGATYHGRLGSDDVHQAIHDSDLVVCPTRSEFHEGLAVVGFEAAAHGVPTALSSVVPAKDLLGGGCVVFRPDSAGAIADAIRGLIEDPEAYRALGRAALKNREMVYDRSASWGSQLALLMENVHVPN